MRENRVGYAPCGVPSAVTPTREEVEGLSPRNKGTISCLSPRERCPKDGEGKPVFPFAFHYAKIHPVAVDVHSDRLQPISLRSPDGKVLLFHLPVSTKFLCRLTPQSGMINHSWQLPFQGSLWKPSLKGNSPVRGNVCEADKRVPVSGGKAVIRKDDWGVLRIANRALIIKV